MAEPVVMSTFEAQPGREAEVDAFLQECRDGIAREPGTTVFFALKISSGRYGTFAIFADNAALETHVHGPTAELVRQRANDLFTSQPAILQATVLASKAGRGLL